MELIPMLLALAVALQGPGWRASAAEVAIEAGASAVTFRNTGRAGVDLWRDGDTAVAGSYTVRATLRKLAGRRREGYGFIIGGRDLGSARARYAYVMIRGDGALLVKQRDGASLTVARDWTTHASIHPDDAQGRADNVLELRVSPAAVSVVVNGAEVATVPAAGVPTEGLIGLRISHSVQLEVRDLTVAAAR